MSSFLSLREQEKIFKEILLPVFKKDGYVYFHEYQNSNFRLFDNNVLFQSTIYGSSSGSHTFMQEISFSQVEDILFEVGLPNIQLDKFNRKKDFLFTIRSRNINLNNDSNSNRIQTKSDCEKYCDHIKLYMETEGKTFNTHYSYLPNILSEMDNLEKEGKYWNGLNGEGGVLYGGFDSNFKGLIISKLCNDKNYFKKLAWIDERIKAKSVWIPYYEKLKERLKTVEPIYNI